MKKPYLEPNVYVLFPDIEKDILTLSNGEAGEGMKIGWNDSVPDL